MSSTSYYEGVGVLGETVTTQSPAVLCRWALFTASTTIRYAATSTAAGSPSSSPTARTVQVIASGRPRAAARL